MNGLAIQCSSINSSSSNVTSNSGLKRSKSFLSRSSSGNALRDIRIIEYDNNDHRNNNNNNHINMSLLTPIHSPLITSTTSNTAMDRISDSIQKMKHRI